MHVYYYVKYIFYKIKIVTTMYIYFEIIIKKFFYYHYNNIIITKLYRYKYVFY